MTATALIIDDERDIRELTAMTLSRMGLDCHTAANLDEARHLLDTYRFDVCLTDMRLPDGNGVEFVRYIQSIQPSLPVAVFTAHGNMQAAVEAMKNGAFDFVPKPVDIGLLRQLVAQAVSLGSSDVETEPVVIAKPPTGFNGAERLIGDSSVMSELRTLIRKVARTNTPVWITGESGTGKELIARLIHDNSPRSAGPFVAINCGAIPSELMESELFGHKKGSFTGASSDHDGLFRRASGGTLFLDEVADLPLHMQVKLLRAIQERTVRPVGGSDEINVDVRLLSASHRDLAGEVDANRFRHDLYYRLNVICLKAPALRDRVGDIPALVEHVLTDLHAKHELVARVLLSADALTALHTYAFPGNVRELENILERALALCENNVIGVEDLSLQPMTGEAPDKFDPRATPAAGTGAVQGMANNEKQRIVAALEATRWNRKAAAERLGMTYRQLRYRIQQLDIDNTGDK